MVLTYGSVWAQAARESFDALVRYQYVFVQLVFLGGDVVAAGAFERVGFDMGGQCVRIEHLLTAGSERALVTGELFLVYTVRVAHQRSRVFRFITALFALQNRPVIGFAAVGIKKEMESGADEASVIGFLPFPLFFDGGRFQRTSPTIEGDVMRRHITNSDCTISDSQTICSTT